MHTPLENINSECQKSHNDDAEIPSEKIETIPSRTMAHMDRAANAMTDMLDAIQNASVSGASEEQLAQCTSSSDRRCGDSIPPRSRARSDSTRIW